uniref:Uncharacterized protein n=1 Tax=Rousettus aegyptiacus TaxID=9407 RepID=A0A7J8F0E4_ROUAE|nr:hypothetical protein HJG63_012297 [Rousettus aegyptiacus]
MLIIIIFVKNKHVYNRHVNKTVKDPLSNSKLMTNKVLHSLISADLKFQPEILLPPDFLKFMLLQPNYQWIFPWPFLRPLLIMVLYCYEIVPGFLPGQLPPCLLRFISRVFSSMFCIGFQANRKLLKSHPSVDLT